MKTHIAPPFLLGSPVPVSAATGAAAASVEGHAFSAHLSDPIAEGVGGDVLDEGLLTEDCAAPVPPHWAGLQADLVKARAEIAGGAAVAGFARSDAAKAVPGADAADNPPDAPGRSEKPERHAASGLPPTLAQTGPNIRIGGSAGPVPDEGNAAAGGGAVQQDPARSDRAGLHLGPSGHLADGAVASGPVWAQGLAAAMQRHAAKIGVDHPGAGEKGGVHLWQGAFFANTDVTAPDVTLANGGAIETKGAALPATAVGLEIVPTDALLPPDLALGEVGLSSGPSGSLASAQGAASVAAQPPVPQLATRLVEMLVHSGNGVTEFSLSPDELGQVRVTLQADAQNPDRMVVMLVFDRQETLDLFRRHADQLADALRAAGYSGVDIGFGQSGTGHGNGPDTSPAVPAEAMLSDEITPDLVTYPVRLAASSSLDLRL